jgi:hypothetical protein
MLLASMANERPMAISAPSEGGTRRFRRYPARVEVKVCFFQEQRSVVTQGMSNDLCAKGMALYIPLQMELGRKIQLGFHLPVTREEVFLDAVVRDSEGFRCGVEFQDLAPSQESALVECCNRLSVMLPDNTARRKWERRIAINVRSGA